MNKRYGAAIAGVCGLALLIAGCGGTPEARPGTSLPTITPSTTTPVATPTPTPTPVDPTTAAKAKVLADYANYHQVFLAGLVKGGANFRYDHVLTGEALAGMNAYIAFHKGVRGTRFSGSAKLTSSMVTAINLKSKPATASVRGCVIDGVTGVSKAGKPVVTPAGRVLKREQLRFLNGRWKVYLSNGTIAEKGVCGA